MIPGLWEADEAENFLDSLGGLTDLTIKYDDPNGKWSRIARFKMNRYDHAMNALKSKCPW
jgi:hypothetical protein